MNKLHPEPKLISQLRFEDSNVGFTTAREVEQVSSDGLSGCVQPCERLSMGGEFFLRLREDHKIEQKTWEEALRHVVDTLGVTADVDHRFDGPEYAFEFEDVEKWGGDPPRSKTFRLAWQWGPNAIQSELGGRRRSDWSTVAKVCKMLCDHFPGQLALVVCDGMSGYEEKDMFYDGTTRAFRKLDYSRWPWV